MQLKHYISYFLKVGLLTIILGTFIFDTILIIFFSNFKVAHIISLLYPLFISSIVILPYIFLISIITFKFKLLNDQSIPNKIYSVLINLFLSSLSAWFLMKDYFFSEGYLFYIPYLIVSSILIITVKKRHTTQK